MLLKQTLRNTLFIIFITVLTAFSGYAFRLLLARNLTVVDYGLFYGMLSFFTFFSVFIDFGIAQSLARTIVNFYLKKAYGIINGLILVCFSIPFFISFLLGFIFLLTYIFTPFLSNYFEVQSVLPFFLFVIYFVTWPVDIVVKSPLLGFQKIKTFSLIDPIRSIIVFIMAGSLFLFGVGILSPFIAYSLVNFLILIIFIYPLYKSYPYFFSEKFVFDKSVILGVFSYGFFLALTSVSWAIIIHTDTLMILFFRDSFEVGLYQIAVPLSYTLLYPVNALNVVAYPLFAKLKATGDFVSLKSGITLLYDYLFVIMIPIAFAFLVFPEIIIELFFGTKFLNAIPALQILTIGALFNSLATFNIGLLTSTGHAKEIARIAIFVSVLNLLLNVLLISKYGFVGAALSTSFSFLILMFLTLRKVRLFYPIVLPIRKWLLNAFCGIVMVGVVWYIKQILNFNVWIELMVVSVLAGFFYLFLVFILRIVVIKDVSSLVKIILSLK